MRSIKTHFLSYKPLFLRFWAKIAFRPFLVLWNWILFSLSESIGDNYDLGSA